MSKRKEPESDVQTEQTTPPESVQNFGIPVTFLDHMNVERSELTDRVESLDRFLAGEKFPALDQEERERLKGQRTAMGHYLEILTARIAYHQARGAQ